MRPANWSRNMSVDILRLPPSCSNQSKMASEGEFRCYNKGCGKFYNEEENDDGVCCFHPGHAIFHDALKGWSCCKRRTTDFTDFLHIPGCTTAKHSNIKPPEPEKTENEPIPDVVKVPAPLPAPLKPRDLTCRPSDGEPRQKLKVVVGASLKADLEKLPAVCLPTEAVKSNGDTSTNTDCSDVEIGVKCKHHACGKSFEGVESISELCRYHPGEAIFHEGLKFWTCCGRKTSDFEQFMRQEGCKAGDHDWPRPRNSSSVEEVKCRYDWHQVGNTVVISIFSKVPVPDQSNVEANATNLSADIRFSGGRSRFTLSTSLFDVIKPEESKVTYLGTKVEVKLCKAEPGSWKTLHLPVPKATTPEKKTSSDQSDDDDE